MATRTHDLSVRYPDASVFCNDRRGDDKALAFDDPRVIIEILSAGTARTDLRVKLDEYKALDSVDTIVFVDTALERLRIVQRTTAHGWNDVAYDEAVDATLPSFGLSLPHDEILRGMICTVAIGGGPSPRYASFMSLFPPVTCPRLIVKIGSALIIEANGGVRRAWLQGIAADIAARAQGGQQVAVVSSGAIALGARRLGLAKGGRASLEDAQAAAAVGQIALSHVWAETLGAEELTAAQILVTLDDLEDRRRYLNAAATLDRLLGLGVVPVLNENDSVATEEIRFGDNDRLAARVAQAAGAQGVVLLSDVDGLYDRNPVLPGAEHIARVERIDGRVEAMADRGSASGMGSGGMVSKIAAARIANAAGAHLAIASGRIGRPLSLTDSTAGRHTLFVAEKSAPARKAWLAGGLTARGTVHIDAGAVVALRAGKSLLAAGATRIEGSFSRGDLIVVAGPDGAVLARGLAEYDAADAVRITGKRSDALAAILGYAPRGALVHRNHMAML